MKNQKHSAYTYMESCCDSSYSTAMNQLIDMELVKIFMPYLYAEEKILWTAKPCGGLKLDGSCLFLFPFGFFFIFITIQDLKQTANPSVSDIMPIITGLFISFGFVIIEFIRRKNCSYAITNQRIFIRSGIFSQKIEYLDIHNLETLKIKVNNKNIGTLTLTQPAPLPKFGKRNSLAELTGFDGMSKLETIEKADEVYELIKHLQEQELR